MLIDDEVEIGVVCLLKMAAEKNTQKIQNKVEAIKIPQKKKQLHN